MDWKKTIFSEVNYDFVSNPYPRFNEYIKVSFRVLRNNPIRNVYMRAIIDGGSKYIKMTISRQTNYFTYYEGWLKVSQKFINYHFVIDIGSEVLFYTRKGIFTYVPTEDNDFVIIAEFENPDWVPGSVFYQIFPDRFNQGKPEISVKTGEYEYRRHKTIKLDWGTDPLPYHQGFCLDFLGGDLYGIKDKIWYLKSIGVNALYLNPIFKAMTNHRYDTIDYFSVDPHLGGNEALRELVDELHKNDMKIILDISINHTGDQHIWFKKALLDINSEERGFYYFNEKNEYRGWAGLSELPQLNYNSKKLREIIFEDDDSVVKYYIKQFDIDGWRFDVANDTGRNGIDQFGNEIFKRIREGVKSIKKNAYLIGEHWEDNISYLLGDQLDGCMNYFASLRPIRSFAGEVDWFLRNVVEPGRKLRPSTGVELEAQIQQHYTRLPNQIAFLQYNLLGSHDIFRFHNTIYFDRDIYKGMLIILFLLPGATSIYYGDEIALRGRTSDIEGCRYPMEWDESKWDRYFLNLYSTLAKLKRSEKTLHLGAYRPVYADEDTFAFARFDLEKCFIGFISRSQVEKEITIPTYHLGVFDESGKDIFTGEEFRSKDGYLTLKISKKKQCLISFKVQG
ncbi:MAG: glycoside hydrolase family 13 protein [Brevinematales bacterium]|nr:glycoside hydrolase family 13 protein [Brevinematales bacterium]